MTLQTVGLDNPNRHGLSRRLREHQPQHSCRAHDGAPLHSACLKALAVCIVSVLCPLLAPRARLLPYQPTRSAAQTEYSLLSYEVKSSLLAPAYVHHTCTSSDEKVAQAQQENQIPGRNVQPCPKARRRKELLVPAQELPPRGDRRRRPNQVLGGHPWRPKRSSVPSRASPRLRAKKRLPPALALPLEPSLQVRRRRCQWTGSLLLQQWQQWTRPEAEHHEAVWRWAHMCLDQWGRHHRPRGVPWCQRQPLPLCPLPQLGLRHQALQWWTLDMWALPMPRQQSTWRPSKLQPRQCRRQLQLIRTKVVPPCHRPWEFPRLRQPKQARFRLRDPRRSMLRRQQQQSALSRAGRLLLPFSRADEEPWSVTGADSPVEPLHAPTADKSSVPRILPITRQENTTQSQCFCQYCGCRAVRTDHVFAQVRAMVLPIKALAGSSACLLPTHRLEAVDSQSPGRRKPTLTAQELGPDDDDVPVSECLLPNCMPVSTRQVQHTFHVPCTSCTSLETLFVAADISAGPLGSSFRESPPDSWTERGTLLWLTTRALGAMGKKKKRVWIPPPPLDCTNLVADDAMIPGADILVTGGAHTRIHGLKGYVLPSSERHSNTVNIRLYQGHATLQSKVWCVDRSNVVVCPTDPPGEDDGLHPSLRWRLRPPPLTVFSARYVLGWESLASMVPPKPEKQPQPDVPAAESHRAPRLWQGVRRISKEGVLLPQPKTKAREDPPLTKLQKELLARMPLMPKGTPKPTAARRDLADLEELEEVIVEPAPEPSRTRKLQTAQPKPKKRPAPRDETAESARESEPKAWPLDPSWPPAPAPPGQPPPRTESLDKPFAAIIQSGKYRAQEQQASRATSSAPYASPVEQASTKATSTASGPKRHRSIWFDSTPASAMATAMKRKKASRRQMYQTVLMISAANRAADAADPSRVYKRACAVSLMSWSLAPPLSCAQQHINVNWPRSSDTATGHQGQTHWDCSKQSSQLWPSPFIEHFQRHRRCEPRAFQAPSASCPVSSLCSTRKPRASSGHGNPAWMTLDNRPGYWQARSPALHQSLTALPGTATGLVPLPRTETSIPVGSWHRHPVRIIEGYFQHSGLPSSLAAGQAARSYALHQTPVKHPTWIAIKTRTIVQFADSQSLGESLLKESTPFCIGGTKVTQTTLHKGMDSRMSRQTAS